MITKDVDNILIWNSEKYFNLTGWSEFQIGWLFSTNFPLLIHFQDGDRFWRMPECYIRGSTIKYLRIPDEVIDMVKEDAQMKARNRQEMKGNRNQQNQRQGLGRPQGGNQNRNQGGFQQRNQGNRPGNFQHKKPQQQQQPK